jgi:hypothetical protein
MTNIMDIHTYAIGGMNLVVALIGFLGGELLELGGEMMCRTRVSIPGGVHVIGRGFTVSTLRGRHGHGELLLRARAIIVDAKEVAHEALVAAGCSVTRRAAQLAHEATSTVVATVAVPGRATAAATIATTTAVAAPTTTSVASS